MHDKIQKFFNLIQNSKEFAYDVETSGLNKHTCKTVGYSVSDGNEAYYIPVRHEGDANIPDAEGFEKTLNLFLQSYTGKIIGHNIKFDMHFSNIHKIELGDKVIDTMGQEALINENQFSFSLENVCKNYNITPKKGKLLYVHIAEQFGCKPTRDSMAHYYRLSGDDELAVEYAEQDTRTTFQLYESQKRELANQDLEQVATLENSLSYVLYKMERHGIKVDLEEAEHVKKKVLELQLEAYQNIPLDEDLIPINVKSQKDLIKYFEWCGITEWPMNAPTDRHPNGSPSFNKNFLGTSQHGLVILEARKYDHLKQSFIDPLPNHIFDGRVYTNFNQTAGEFGGTKTGRLSSSNPNMQQIPKRDEFTGRIFRKMFIPDNDFVFVEFDYSQAEPRLFTHYSKEPFLVKGYNSTPAVDMHSIAAQYMNIDRKVAKNLNLGMMYVMGYAALAGHLNIDLDDARYMAQRWHRTFPRVSDFTKAASKRAEQRGYVRTIIGRRARFPDPRFSYKAANRIVQGGSADILKYKMVEIDRWLTNTNAHHMCQMLLNTHDAILFQIHKDYLYLIEDIERIMCDLNGAPFNLTVPFAVDYKKGNNWSEASYGG